MLSFNKSIAEADRGGAITNAVSNHNTNSDEVQRVLVIVSVVLRVANESEGNDVDTDREQSTPSNRKTVVLWRESVLRPAGNAPNSSREVPTIPEKTANFCELARSYYY